MSIRLLAGLLAVVSSAGAAVRVTGELRRWGAVTLTFDGPQTSEDADPNPFTTYAMDVHFRHAASGRSYRVPGYFAADGQAHESSATAGNKWRVHFVPDEAGSWEYAVSFPNTPLDATKGALKIGPAAKGARGTLRYTGGYYLQYAGTGEYYLKGGADSPENFLAYEEFDATHDADADSGSYKKVGPFVHKYAAHVKDWKTGDPVWKGGKGKGIIGALKYLAGKGVNSVYFLTYNLDGGDGRDTWMWTGPEVRDRFDVSKLDQWEIVFRHMDRLGIMLHVVTQETENDRRLGGGPGLNAIRKLYLRELVARFAHHNAVLWNLGEENNTPDADRKEIAAYIRSIDAYKHPITVHTHNNRSSTFYNGLLGDPSFEATSIQGEMKNYNQEAISLRKRSAAAGRKWVIMGDEQSSAARGVLPDESDPEHDVPRTQALWGNLMGGGGGVEWYFGHQFPHMDINLEDFRSRDKMWDQTRHALTFFRQHLPFWEMEPDNDRSPGAMVFAKGDDVVVVYLPTGGEANVKLGPGRFDLSWYNPRTGGPLTRPTIIEGNGVRPLGRPPGEGDWAALIRKKR
jgi:hypothetical protein